MESRPTPGRRQTTKAGTSWVVVALIALAGCGEGRSSPPRERIAAPLNIAGNSNREAGIPRTSDADPDQTGAEAAPGDDESRAPEGDSDSREAGTRSPQPARALELATEADQAAEQGNSESAVVIYGRAIEVDRTEPWFRVARAWHLARLAQAAQARDDLERALDETSTHDQLVIAAAHHGLGELQLSRHDLTRARESFRMALRSWAGPPLARSLLGISPPGSDQREAMERLAYGKAAPLVERLRGSPVPVRGELVSVIGLDQGALVSLTVTPTASATELPRGAVYRLVVAPVDPQPDAGTTPREVVLGEATPVRWLTAVLEPYAGGGKTFVVATVEVFGPGAGAPSKTTSVVAELRPDGPVKLLSRPTGQAREAPLGCHRGWREEVRLVDGDGDGVPDTLRTQRLSFIQARYPLDPSVCPPEERRAPGPSTPLPSSPIRSGM